MLCIIANFFTHKYRERKGILGAAMREFEGSGTPDTAPYAEWLVCGFHRGRCFALCGRF